MNMRHLSQESNSLPLDHHHNPLESFTNKVVRTDNITVPIYVGIAGLCFKWSPLKM